MQVQLPAAIEARLVRQVLVQKERGAMTWGNGGLPLPLAQARSSYKDIRWEGFFPIQLPC